MLNAIIHGIILSFGLILPLGVQNVFVFNQGATHKRFVGALPVVLTASICDSLLISLAVLGVSVIVFGIFWVKAALLGVGILFLLYMGYVTWNSKPDANRQKTESFTPMKQVMFAASVSLLNPHAIMDTIGVIGTSSLSYQGMEKWAFTLSCIIVSWIWFTGLAIAGHITGKIDTAGKGLAALNKISALIMWGTALYLISTLIK
ncbi:LysE/ArgO family amino acid transporter [Bacillus sp. T33-2]|uniref:LysE/ArgO family amino acid transporter n=1 Tax=Bacillus sp. T33-2 TaxID=2054168 RepID=UPI000C78CB36|nr:LysE/ArgO family amino acid transporter [Bacillus sp. T33-2]PLR94168.1 lysine transporter LysE [Bacillus sp. T33-2]